MTGRVQSLRSNVAGNRPTGRQPGELYVNWPDKQLGVVDNTATAVDLLAVRFFSTTTSYNPGDYVVQGGKLYTAKGAVPPGAFNSTQWSLTGGNVAIGDTAPATPDVGALWFDTAGGQLYVWYNDGNTTQWVIATNAAKTDLSTLVPLAGGTMTGPLILAADPAQNLGAATKQYVDGVRYGDNRIINGDMRIDQRNNGASGTASGYTVDRWNYSTNQTNKGSWGRVNSGTPNTFPFALTFTSSSAFTSAAGDYFAFIQPIEADMISDFAWGTAGAQPVTLSFLAYSSLTGTFSGAIRNGTTPQRTYPFSYSIPVASTWTRIAITIPADTTGTWPLSGNGVGLYLRFDLGCGSTYRSPANAWANGDYMGATGSVSVVSTNGATFYLTGVKLEVGSIATPFNRQSLAKSLADCQRYYQVFGYMGYGYSNGAGAVQTTPIVYPVSMRAGPTATTGTVSYSNCSALNFQTPASTNAWPICTVTGAGAYNCNTATLMLSAEL